MAAVPPRCGLDSEASVDPQLRDYGANPTREAMRVLIAVARHLAPVPGHKSLIWISGDTALIDWASQKPGTGSYGMKNKYLDEIADKTGEALNQAHISVYPLDASAVPVRWRGRQPEEQECGTKPGSSRQCQHWQRRVAVSLAT